MCLWLFSGCALPPLKDRSPSHALSTEQARETRLGTALAPLVADHPGQSGVHALPNARNAFVARAMLARAAERTLDVQYYIWQDDLTGILLLRELHKAAERGVRVRLLLDDNGIRGLDADLAALDAHPDIQVRLFNPFMLRHPKWVGYITDFARLNHRMHNKSFTADNRASIVGGRNIGDQYFGAGGGALYADLDVLAIGPVVNRVSDAFDDYWTSASAYPADRILPDPEPGKLAHLAARAQKVARHPAGRDYVNALRTSRFTRQLLDSRLAFEFTEVRMVSDDPAKGLGKASDSGLLLNKLDDILGDPDSHVALISPYFVPAKAGTRAFRRLAENDIEVRILSNSLAATDVLPVHAGYAKRRKALLDAGIQLYEMRPMGGAPERDLAGPLGSSASSLHAKTFAVDGERVFIGSFNFDPRSMNLNTEMGFVIDSPGLARRITDAFDDRVPQNAYEVRLDADGSLYWLERRSSEVVRHDSEPDTAFWRRWTVYMLSWLPIDWLL